MTFVQHTIKVSKQTHIWHNTRWEKTFTKKKENIKRKMIMKKPYLHFKVP
jgi:hypothetical protein